MISNIFIIDEVGNLSENLPENSAIVLQTKQTFAEKKLGINMSFLYIFSENNADELKKKNTNWKSAETYVKGSTRFMVPLNVDEIIKQISNEATRIFRVTE